MTLSLIVPVILLALQWTIVGWVAWRYFHLRENGRWRSAGPSFGVALIFLLNAALAATDMPAELFLTISLVTCGVSLFVCGLWLGMALVMRDHASPVS